MALPLNVTPRYLKARLRPMFRPAFLGSTALVLGSSVLIILALRQPQQFVATNEAAAANEQANRELTPENRAAGADIDDLSVLLKDIDNGGSAPALNLPTDKKSDGIKVPEVKSAEGPKPGRSKGEQVASVNEFLTGTAAQFGGASATQGEGQAGSQSVGMFGGLLGNNRNGLGSLMISNRSEGQAPDSVSPLQAALNAQSNAKANALLLEQTVQSAVKERTQAQGTGLGDRRNALPTLDPAPLSLPSAPIGNAYSQLTGQLTGQGQPIGQSTSGQLNSGASLANPSNLGYGSPTAGTAVTAPSYNPGYAAPVYNNSGYVAPATGAAGASNYVGGTGAGVGYGTGTNAYGTPINSGYVTPVNPVYGTPVYGAPPAPTLPQADQSYSVPVSPPAQSIGGGQIRSFSNP